MPVKPTADVTTETLIVDAFFDAMSTVVRGKHGMASVRRQLSAALSAINDPEKKKIALALAEKINLTAAAILQEAQLLP